MIGSTLPAFCGLGLGLVFGAWFGLGPIIGGVAQRMIGVYEDVAPALIFAILAPSILRLLRLDRTEARRFTLYAVGWFSLLRLTVLLAATVLVALLYRMPLAGPAEANWNGASILPLIESRYLWTVVLAGATALALRRHDGPAVAWFMRLPDFIEAAGNVLTRFTALFGFLIGVYIVSLPGLLAAASGFAPHPVLFRWFAAGADTPMTIYLAVTAATALLCLLLHASLLTWARLALPRFSVRGYLTGYLLRVYPLIWSTGAESLAIPSNLATLRRYGGDVTDSLRDLTAGLAATLNLNGTPICCLVLVPAVCMAIGHPLSVLELLTCLPLIFVLSYAIPGIPGELAIFADPIARVLGLTDAERALFLVFFLSWQIGLPDSFRSAGSATDAVPATLLLTHAYRKRFS